MSHHAKARAAAHLHLDNAQRRLLEAVDTATTAAELDDMLMYLMRIEARIAVVRKVAGQRAAKFEEGPA